MMKMNIILRSMRAPRTAKSIEISDIPDNVVFFNQTSLRWWLKAQLIAQGMRPDEANSIVANAEMNALKNVNPPTT